MDYRNSNHSTKQDAAEKPRKPKKNHKRRRNPALQDTKKALLEATKTIKVPNQ